MAVLSSWTLGQHLLYRAHAGGPGCHGTLRFNVSQAPAPRLWFWLQLPTENCEGNGGILEVPGWLVMAGLCAFTREQGDGGGLYAGGPGVEGQRPPSPTGAFPGQDDLPWR